MGLCYLPWYETLISDGKNRTNTDTLSQLVYVLYSACMIIGAIHGIGRHLAELAVDDQVIAMRVRLALVLTISVIHNICRSSLTVADSAGGSSN